MQLIVDLELCDIVQKVDPPDLKAGHRQPRSLAQVGQQAVVILRLDEFDPFIGDRLPAIIAAAPFLFADVQHQDDDGVGDQQRRVIALTEQDGIDHRQGHQDKQVGHFAHRNGICAVAKHPENGKQANAKAYAELDAPKQAGDEKHDRVVREKGEHVLFAAPDRVIDPANDDQRRGQVDEKP